MTLNRELQRDILIALRECYPRAVGHKRDLPNHDDRNFDGNLFYLTEHGLITANFAGMIAARAGDIKITATGLDFLEGDGGVSAILNTVTVRFDRDDLTRILEAHLIRNEVPDEKRSELMETIRRLPADTLRTMWLRLVTEGLEKIPDVGQYILRMIP